MQPMVPGTLSNFLEQISLARREQHPEHFFSVSSVQRHSHQKSCIPEIRPCRPKDKSTRLHYRSTAVLHSEYHHYFPTSLDEAGQPLAGTTSILFSPWTAKAHHAGSLRENVLWGFPETKAHDPWWPTELSQPTPTSPCLVFCHFPLLHSFAYLDELGKFPAENRVHLEAT